MKAKKITCVLLTLAMVFTLFGYAAAENQEAVFSEMYLNRMGDVNGDGAITANDAREALRASAQLSVLSDLQKRAADLDANGLTSADARKILRVSAGLDSFDDIDIYTSSSQILNVGHFKNPEFGKYSWRYTLEPEDAVTAIVETAVPPQVNYKGSVNTTFKFRLKGNEDCKITLQLINLSDNSVEEELSFNLCYYRTGLEWDDWETISEHLTDYKI